jgi:hypothetical protein
MHPLQERRLRGRGTETDASLALRLSVAQEEIDFGLLMRASVLAHFLFKLRMQAKPRVSLISLL